MIKTNFFLNTKNQVIKNGNDVKQDLIKAKGIRSIEWR